MAQLIPSKEPPASQSFPLFYIYRRLGKPIPLIPLDELPLWLQVGERDWADPWWLKDMTAAVEKADPAREEKDVVPQNRNTTQKKRKKKKKNKFKFLPVEPSAALIPGQKQEDIFLRLLDPGTKEEMSKKVHCYVPGSRLSQLERFPFRNEFMRRIVESRRSEFKPRERLYDPNCPIQKFYLGYGRYPYLWGIFGEVIVFPEDDPPSSASASLPSSSPVEWEPDDDPIAFEPGDSDPALSLGLSIGEVPLRETISAPEYLTTGPMGGRPEGLSEGVSLAAGIEYLLQVMGIGDRGS